MNPYLRALLRFWWIVILGAIAGALVGTLMVYNADVAWPPKELPKLTAKEKESFQTSGAYLVTSPYDPYIQTQTREVVDPLSRIEANLTSPRGGAGKAGKSSTSKQPASSESPPLETRTVPDKGSLIRAANIYPLLIESDFITTAREKLTGPLPGFVRAKAIYARQSGGRYRPSSIPVIEIVATSPRPKSSIALVEGTAKAFKAYLAASQKRAKVPKERRILIRELAAPTRIATLGGPSYGLPLLASAAVLFAFGGIAVLLDKAFPRRRRPVVAVDAPDEGQVAAAPGAEEHARLELIENQPEALGAAVAQIAREVGALRAQAKPQAER